MNKKEYAKIIREFKKSQKEKEFKNFLKAWFDCWEGPKTKQAKQECLNSVLHRKIWHGSFDRAKQLLNAGAEINSICEIHGYGTPLDMMMTVYSSEKSMIAFLKKKGAKTKKELFDKVN